MIKLSVLKNNAGFTLVQAIFILVVLSLLGLTMMRLIGVQSSTSVFALQGARAYQAARSGLEWGAAQAASRSAGTGGDCNTLSTAPLKVGAFEVEVTCPIPPEQFREGPIGPYDVYLIKAVATFGDYNSSDYISRKAEMKVGFP